MRLKPFVTVSALAILFALFIPSRVFPQSPTIKILGGNTLNGILQGAALGGAYMGLADDDDFAPLRVGVGAGILYGIGTGIYDLSTSKGNTLLVTGTFNNGDVSTIIVLLDTVYGAAAGSLIASAVLLITNEPLADGLQYGASAGAWVGFGFGLFDAFVLSERIPGGIAHSNSLKKANGLFTLESKDNFSASLIQPAIYSQITQEADNLSYSHSVGVNLLNVNINF